MTSNEPLLFLFESLSTVPDIVHGFFTRHGGFSKPPYDTLNVAWNNGDIPENVNRNLLMVRQSLELEMLVGSEQVHGDTIHVIDGDTFASSEPRFPVLVTPPGDALVTQMPGIGLLIKVADCQAVFLVDPIQKVISNVHCGWRGSVQNILGKVVGFLQDKYKCRPEGILAAIGPSLGPCCAEFINYKQELDPAFWSYQRRPQYFDFWEISRNQLLNAGLHHSNIEVAARCTVCNPDHFFSYRGQGTTGRMAAVIGLKKL